LKDMKGQMHEMNRKLPGHLSDRNDVMTSEDIGNDSNYLNLYLSSFTHQINDITSHISSEFISINRKHALTTQSISELNNNMNMLKEGIMNELTNINHRLLSPPPVPVIASNDIIQLLEVNTARLTSHYDGRHSSV